MRLAVQGMNPSRTTGNAQTTAWRSAAQSIDADHSCGWLDSKAAAGRMDIRVATAHPDRHALMSCVMGDAIDQVEVSQTPLKLDAGDIIVVATELKL